VTKLVVRLTGEAEKGFRELLSRTTADEKEVVLDALALLHFAVFEKTKGKQIAVFDPKTKEATVFSLPTLNLTKTKE